MQNKEIVDQFSVKSQKSHSAIFGPYRVTAGNISGVLSFLDDLLTNSH